VTEANGTKKSPWADLLKLLIPWCITAAAVIFSFGVGKGGGEASAIACQAKDLAASNRNLIEQLKEQRATTNIELARITTELQGMRKQIAKLEDRP